MHRKITIKRNKDNNMKLINLIPLQEIDFPNQRAFDSYNKIHKLRPDTKVVVAGRVTTAGRASQNSPSPVKGTSVFGGDDKEKAVNKEKYPVGTKFFKPNGNQNIEVVRVEGDKIFVVSDIMPGKEWQWREDGIDDDIKNQKLQVKSDASPIPKAEPGSFLDAFQKINPGYDANKTLADFSKESEADLDDTDSDPEDRAEHEEYVKSATEWFNKVATTKPTVKPGDLVKVNMKSTGKEGIGKIVEPVTMQGNYGFMGQVAPDKQPAWKIDCYTEKNIGTDKKPIDVNGKKYYYQGTLYYPQHEEGDKEAFSKLGGKEYPTFGNPLEGFPTEYKELLKKLQRSNNSNERTKLIDKMNVIRKKLNLKPLTNILKKNTDTSLSSMIPNKATQKYDPATAFNQKVSKMTDNNAHSAAAVELAIYMDDKEAVSKLQQIKKYHDNRGYLQPGEAKERGEIVNNLLQRAQKELPKKDFDLVSNSF
jgi:hypothetical protein